MKNMTSFAGWILLAAVLVVPSFLFYNWWSAKTKAKSASERTQKMNSSAIFPVAGKTTSYSALTSTFPAPQAHSLPVVRGQAGVTAAPAALAAAPATVPASVTTAPATVSATVALSSAAVSVKSRTSSYFKPKSGRDPTISPMEYRQMKEEEDRRAEAERQRLANAKKIVKEKGVEYKMELQGIVGDFVIINGDRYTVGQTVLGAKILKVGGDYFIGQHKGRQFRKVMR